MVIVTHDLENAFNVAHRILMLDRGKIAALGTPAEIRRSANPWVRSFLQRASSSARRRRRGLLRAARVAHDQGDGRRGPDTRAAAGASPHGAEAGRGQGPPGEAVISKQDKVWVGVFVAATLAILVAFLGALWGIRASKHYKRFHILTKDSVGGLSPSAPVKYLGVDTGRVEKMEIEDNEGGDEPPKIRITIAVTEGDAGQDGPRAPS